MVREGLLGIPQNEYSVIIYSPSSFPPCITLFLLQNTRVLFKKCVFPYNDFKEFRERERWSTVYEPLKDYYTKSIYEYLMTD